MSNGRLLWFRSTEWLGFSVEGQTFQPDADGYFAVPENLVAQFRHPSLQYVGRERPKKPEELQIAVAVSPNASSTMDVAATSGDDTSLKTVSYAELKRVIDLHGNAAEDKLIAHAKLAFPQKSVPRKLLRKAREELFGKPRRGAPQKRPNKSPE